MRFLIVSLTDILGVAGEINCWSHVDYHTQQFVNWMVEHNIAHTIDDEKNFFSEADEDLRQSGYDDTYQYNRYVEIPNEKDAVLFKLRWSDEIPR